MQSSGLMPPRMSEQAPVDRRDKDYASAAYAASEVHRLTAELAAYVPEEQPEISDLPDYAAV